MAAVLMHKLPRHSLLHDLLHLQDRLGKTWNFSHGSERGDLQWGECTGSSSAPRFSQWHQRFHKGLRQLCLLSITSYFKKSGIKKKKKSCFIFEKYSQKTMKQELTEGTEHHLDKSHLIKVPKSQI